MVACQQGEMDFFSHNAPNYDRLVWVYRWRKAIAQSRWKHIEQILSIPRLPQLMIVDIWGTLIISMDFEQNGVLPWKGWETIAYSAGASITKRTRGGPLTSM